MFDEWNSFSVFGEQHPGLCVFHLRPRKNLAKLAKGLCSLLFTMQQWLARSLQKPTEHKDSDPPLLSTGSGIQRHFTLCFYTSLFPENEQATLPVSPVSFNQDWHRSCGTLYLLNLIVSSVSWLCLTFPCYKCLLLLWVWIHPAFLLVRKEGDATQKDSTEDHGTTCTKAT